MVNIPLSPIKNALCVILSSKSKQLPIFRFLAKKNSINMISHQLYKKDLVGGTK